MSTMTKGVSLEAGTQAFVDALAASNDPPIYTLAPEQARAVLEKAQANPGYLPSSSVEEIELRGGPSVTIFRPPDIPPSAFPPGILYLHGGGWILGSARTHERLVRSLGSSAGSTIIFVNFSPAPEAAFPVPVEEAYRALQYFATHGKEHGIDSKRLAVAGDSAGANMATVVAMLAAVRGEFVPLSQLLLYPVTDADFGTRSYQEFAEGPWLTRRAMEWFWNAYAPSFEDRQKWEVSPLRAPGEYLAALPDSLIITAEADVLRDEGEAYAHRLMDAGVRTRAIRYLGTIHDFAMLNGLAETPPARHAMSVAGEFLSETVNR